MRIAFIVPPSGLDHINRFGCPIIRLGCPLMRFAPPRGAIL